MSSPVRRSRGARRLLVVVFASMCVLRGAASSTLPIASTMAYWNAPPGNRLDPCEHCTNGEPLTNGFACSDTQLFANEASNDVINGSADRFRLAATTSASPMSQTLAATTTTSSTTPAATTSTASAVTTTKPIQLIYTGWNNGRSWFRDPVPPGNDVVSLNVTLYGRFNCIADMHVVQLSLLLGSEGSFSRLLGYALAPNTPTGCACGNCAVPVNISSDWFPEGLAGYAYGGLNYVQVQAGRTICLSAAQVVITYLPRIPIVHDMVPRGGNVAGGTEVSFPVDVVNPASLLQCMFGSYPVNVTVAPDERSLKCVSPPYNMTAYANGDADDADDELAGGGKVTVSIREHVPSFSDVRDGGGGLSAQKFQFVYYETPVFVDVEPVRGSSLGGVDVKISGENLVNVFDEALCFFGERSAKATVHSDTAVTCRTPPGNGTVPIDFSPNGVERLSTEHTFTYESVESYLYIILAFLFVCVSVSIAVTLRILMHRRQRRRRLAGTLGFVNERTNLLAGETPSEAMWLDSVDPTEIEILERVGKGTYGEVYKGLWRGTIVGVKKLPAHNVTKDFFPNFLKEVQIMKQLRHPNVLQFLGACLTDDHRDLAILMEFMPRSSLWAVLHDKTIDLPWSTRLRHFLLDAARGMNYLHNCKPVIIHRDLKSHNLLVDDAWRVKVCDFGLSRIIESSPSMNTMTACGTPCWTAPEVLRNERYSTKADVYSFGIVLWECVTREDPFALMPPFQVVFAVGTTGLRPTIPLDCPHAVAALMRACWDESAAKRPSFAAILDRLEKIP